MPVLSVTLEAVLTQPALQFLSGVTLTLLVRAVGYGFLASAGKLSRRVTQLRLSGILEELTLYKFFERRPAVLMARATELQLWAGFFSICFCLAWAVEVTSPSGGAIRLAAAVAATFVASIVGWFLFDLFRLVYPISHFQTYEMQTQQRIARMKTRVDVSSRRLKTQQEELEELDANLARMASIAETGAFEDAPFFDESSSQPATASTKSDIPSDTTAPARPVARPVEAITGQSPQSVGAAHADVRPRAVASGTVTQGSVYQSAWMSGRVKRWPDGAAFGFITADTGEVFYAGADNLAGLEPIEEDAEVLFQPIAGTPHRRAVLVCAIRGYAQGRVNGVRGNMGFITIQDSRRSASIYFRLPVGMLPDFNIGDTVGFRFGRNILGPTAERIDPDLDSERGSQWRQR